MAPTSSTLVHAYQSMLDGDSTPTAPRIGRVATDQILVGTVMTHSFNRLITDSAAAGLVVTNTVNHATPAYKDIPVVVAGPLLIIEYRLLAYSSHVRNRNALGAIAEQELGYSGILRQKLDPVGRYSGSDRRAFLTSEILPAYGLEDATGSEIDRLLAGNFTGNLASIMNSRTG
ncbi:hypothetical protein S40285_10516 [Stachybotrys chlorohalonatus IBT 40285]|uniref:Uncharacterized protein n=1 Tax=Stachybotrys chlorohalonatus (strain IBT 40285) TaxID=1283841 RepID=A0A084QCZ4_STAC4|nr:hypothetical protein S40285_10516 [Stachybotrys chlorohalonata IBT 40285]